MRNTIILAGCFTTAFIKEWESNGFHVINEQKLTSMNTDAVMNWLANGGKDAILFSFDYYLTLAEAANKVQIPYASWLWDSPCNALYHKSSRYPTTYLFAFDYNMYEDLLRRGHQRAFYLPLTTDYSIFQKRIKEENYNYKYNHDVAFIGNLYNDINHSLYDQIKYLPEYLKGYFEGVMDIQKRFWGVNILESCLTDSILDMMKQIVKWDVGPDYEEGVYEKQIYSMLAMRLSRVERMEMCNALSERFDFAIYTGCDTSFNPNIKNLGYVDYYREMPLIFHNSKINIHITMRSITSGMSLRVMDVLASEGFLLTNYQAEILEYFEDGVDLVVYNSLEDMIEKIEYYLSHEEERQQIAHSGYLKFLKVFSYEVQIPRLIGMLRERLV